MLKREDVYWISMDILSFQVYTQPDKGIFGISERRFGKSALFLVEQTMSVYRATVEAQIGISLGNNRRRRLV